jgi:hydrogenase maturation protease
LNTAVPRVLIIAYGNPLRCDDGLAWRVAEALSQPDLPDDIAIITSHQLTPELAQPISQASTVLFLDASRAGVPGDVLSVSLHSQPGSSAFSHNFSPQALLALAQELYGHSAEAFLISVSGACFDHGDTLSPKVIECLPRVIHHVRELANRPASALLP